MTAIATQFNPGDPGEEILAFYNDKAANLGFELVPASSTSPVTYASADPETSGLIRNPSQLAAIYFNDLTRVYAISDKDSEIVLISPGLKTLSLTTEKIYGSLAGASDGKQAAWLYYLKGNPGRIVQHDLAVKVSKELNFDNVLPQTALAACYDSVTKKPFLIYQSNESAPILIRSQGNSSDEVTNSDTAAANTPLAAVAHPTRTQVQIYFKNTADMMVHRISWNPAEDNNPYSDSTPVGEAPVDDFSTIAAVAGPDGTRVHVFYVYNPDENTRALAHVVDNWHEAGAT